MKKTINNILLLLLIFGGIFYLYFGEKETEIEDLTPYQIEVGGIFNPGAYIEISNVQIMYNGNNSFTATNNGEQIMMITVNVVGVKSDGTNELIECIPFGGVDEVQYENDKVANGWAIQQYTNKVRPKDSLTSTVEVFDFGHGSPKPDIDNDGYYDLTFLFSPQDSMDSIHVSTDDPEAGPYKLPVE
ncbi:MAG: hypothetical protein VB078_11745 [Clostridiaceae bacterium]|nr:hypothetical protein [Clostridiaceae bacterium]